MARILKKGRFQEIFTEEVSRSSDSREEKLVWRNRSEPAVTNTWTFWFTPLSCCSTYPVTPLHSRVITAAFCGRFRHMTEGKRDWRGVRFFLIDGPIFAFHDSHLKGKKIIHQTLKTTQGCTHWDSAIGVVLLSTVHLQHLTDY